MDRKNFFKKCGMGACSCIGMYFLLPENLLAEDNNSEVKEDWRFDFIKVRMAKLVELMDSNLDGDTKNILLEGLGRTCSVEWKEPEKYIGDFDGFLDNIVSKWTEKINYDKENGIVETIGKKKETCFCPFVDADKMPKDFCTCSVGFTKQCFETVLGKEVEVEMTATILNGNDRCSSIIKIV